MKTKKSFMVPFYLGVFLTATLPVSLPTQAAIDEFLMYPGANCHKVSGSGTPTIDPFEGRIKNAGSTDITVLCPMYDRGKNFTGRISVLDPNQRADIICRSIVAGALDTAIYILKKTSGSSDSPMVLDFNGPNASAISGYRFYTCILPPGTSITSYRGQAL
jgi:hypothetical protein